MSVVRNFNGVVAERNFEKEGVYPVTITSVTSGMNKANTAEQDIIQVATSDGFTGTLYLTYLPTMLGSIKGQLQLLGINLDNGFDPQSIVGLQTKVDVTFQVQQTKDEWGNVTGSKVSDFPNLRFTSKDLTVNMGQPQQPAVAAVPQQQQPIANPLNAQPAVAAVPQPTSNLEPTNQVVGVTPETPVQGIPQQQPPLSQQPIAQPEQQPIGTQPTIGQPVANGIM